MPRVVHFEFTADDPNRAARFYADVFGWETSRWNNTDEYWLVKTGSDAEAGINGGMMLRRTESPNATTSIEVDSIDHYIQLIVDHGGIVVVPKTVVPGTGAYAYCKDSEGNIFGLMQKEEAL